MLFAGTKRVLTCNHGLLNPSYIRQAPKAAKNITFEIGCQLSHVSCFNASFSLFRASSRFYTSKLYNSEISFGSGVSIPSYSLGEDRISLPSTFYPQFDSLLLETQESLQVFRWLAQKDKLDQDMILLGPPGPLRRRMVLYYCELTNRQHEVISLTRDVSEMDLTLRREIIDKNTHWIDQVAVRAALEGKILIIDGLEKADRGIMPILNNLLENREMNLEDGRFLMSSKRFDQLIASKSYTREQLKELKVHRVHEDFRVIALCLPTPKYPGNPLDPPLRSRLQAKWIPSSSLSSDLSTLNNLNYGVSPDSNTFTQMQDIALLAATMIHAVQETKIIGDKKSVDLLGDKLPPPFPQPALWTVIRYLETFGPCFNLADVLLRTYPVQLLEITEKKNGLLKHLFGLFDRFKIKPSWTHPSFYTSIKNQHNFKPVEMNFGDQLEWKIKNSSTSFELSQTAPDAESIAFTSSVTMKEINMKSSSGTVTMKVPCGSSKEELKENDLNTASGLVLTPVRQSVLFGMIQDHCVGKDIALLGPSGSGKSILVDYFAQMLSYEIETVLLHKDMIYRDLLQRRGTDKVTGDTIWINSGLVEAALHGRLAVLDHIDRVTCDSLVSLQSLLLDRRIQLPDGTRLVHHEEYFQMDTQKRLLGRYKPIHPAFRVIVMGDFVSQTPKSVSDNVFNIETLTLFQFSVLPAMSEKEELDLVLEILKRKSCHSKNQKELSEIVVKLASKVTQFAFLLRQHGQFGQGWSLRQTIRTLETLMIHEERRHHGRFGGDLEQLVVSLLQQGVLSQFLPHHAKLILESILKSSGLPKPLVITNEVISSPSNGNVVELERESEKALKDQVLMDHLVPQIEFFDNPQHTRLLEEMRENFELGGHHLLLIGNQGTGKNKLTDKFLEQMKRQRQYLQLHRDTTIASLTCQPTIKNNQIVYEDSPLVKAVRNGQVLVLDEVDKAEVEVVSVLKNLVDGEMVLADGRRIVSAQRQHLYAKEPSTIVIHPNFKMVVLANRPGWPFLGNDFFMVCGDLFATLQISNPDLDSEMHLLAQFGPSVPKKTLLRLANTFSELRALNDERGSLTYPYSTRECVNIVKHLEMFPNDPLGLALENVFAFDVCNEQAKQFIFEAFYKNELFSESDAAAFLDEGILASTAQKVKMELLMSDAKKETNGMPRPGKIDPANCPHVGGSTWAGGTGGSMTAGLGGKGGPYRYDAGHQVVQLSDKEKSNVSQTIKDAAKNMADEELSKRLKDIEMDKADSKWYEQLHQAVRMQVTQLRIILEALKSKNSAERQWTRNQQTGELDESKIVDGIIGDKAIYKRRIIPTNTNPFAPMKKPKLIRFVIDMSGSMYRFNSTDSRLDRMVEIVTLIMEAFDGFDDRIQYSIVGHSGDSPEIKLVNFGNSPKNRNERYKVIQRIIAHTQFCSSGDYTIEATKKAVDTMQALEADEKFVFMFSDANLDRYGIPPSHLAYAMKPSDSGSNTDNNGVQAHAIFIASLFRGQTTALVTALPPGSAHICMDTSDLPSLFNKLLSATALKL